MDPLFLIAATIALLALSKSKGGVVASDVQTSTQGTPSPSSEPDSNVGATAATTTATVVDTGQRVHLMSVDDSTKNIALQSQGIAQAELRKLTGVDFTGDGTTDLASMKNWFIGTLKPRLQAIANDFNAAMSGGVHNESVRFVNEDFTNVMLEYVQGYPDSGLSYDPTTKKHWTKTGIQAYFAPTQNDSWGPLGEFILALVKQLPGTGQVVTAGERIGSQLGYK